LRARTKRGEKGSVRKRHLLENFFERIKNFRPVATRHDKLAQTFFGFACLAAATGQHARAGRLFGAADAALKSLGTELSPTNRIDRARGLDMARACGEDAFGAAYTAGQSLVLGDAVLEALTDGTFREPSQRCDFDALD